MDIASGAQEQATGLAQVNSAINQMDQADQQNASMVEQSTAASHSLSQEARQLADLVGQFELGRGERQRRAHPQREAGPGARLVSEGWFGRAATAAMPRRP